MSRRESQEGSQDDTLVVLAEGSMRAPLVRGGELARSLGTGASSERAHDGAASFCFSFLTKQFAQPCCFSFAPATFPFSPPMYRVCGTDSVAWFGPYLVMTCTNIHMSVIGL